MRVSKVSLAVILAMIFSASARSQDSNSKAVGKPSTSQLQNSSGQSRKPANIQVSSAAPNQARLLGVRVSAEQSSSRIELKTAALGRYSVGRLSNPDRLYVHLLTATVDPQLKTPQIAGQDPLVSGIRIGNYEDSVTRVVFDLKAPASYQISELPGGLGVIIELTSETGHGGAGPNTRGATTEPEPNSPRNVASEKQSPSVAISNPDISIRPSAPDAHRTILATPVATLLATPSEPTPRMKGDAVDAENKQSVVAVGSFPSGKDLPLATFAAVPAARNRGRVGEAEFPAAADEAPNANRKTQAKSDLLESFPLAVTADSSNQ